MSKAKDIIKLKGFTLMEMLFVILLTSIIVSLTFLYFNSIQRYIFSQSGKSDFELEIMRFETILKYDINSSHSYSLTDRELLFDDIQVYYSFDEDFILREQNNNFDTLYVSQVEVTPVFQKDFKNLLIQLYVSFIDNNYQMREYVFLFPRDVFKEYRAFQNNNDDY